MWRKWQGLTLWIRVMLGLGLGIFVGIILIKSGHEEFAVSIRPLGTIFINAIKMLMVPIVFITIASGITSLADPAKLGKLGLKTIILYFMTTAFAVVIGLIVATILSPGDGAGPAVLAASTGDAAPRVLSIWDLLVDLIPSNPVAAMAEGNVLQIIVFAILFGLAVNMGGEKTAPVKKLIDALAEAMYKLVHIVMEFAPYGVFVLILWMVATLDRAALSALPMVVVTLYVACILQIIIVYWGGVTFLLKLNPVRFIRGIIDAQAVAYSTSTSAGTLPVTLSNVQDNLGVSKNVAGFVLPVGATMNMDGTAIYMGVAAVFTAQAIGVDLTMVDYFTIILTGVLASIGAASIPSAGLIIMPVVLSAVGLPLGAIALFFAIDRIMDMMRTLTNVTGDAFVSVAVAKSEGELDQEVYDHVAVE